MQYDRDGSYDSIDLAWWACLSRLMRRGHEHDSRAGRCRELLGMTFVLSDLERTLLCHEARQLDPAYAAGETLWYLSGSDRIDMIKHYASSYARFSDDGVTAHGAYGPRIMPHLATVRKFLVEAPETRQCVLPIYQVDDFMVASDPTTRPKDVPCTETLAFFCRQGRLWMHAHMRSNDAWLGLPYDVFAFTCIQRVVARMVGVPVGGYIHSATSVHLYEKHWERAKAIVTGGPGVTYPHGWGERAPVGESTMDLVALAIDVEASVRTEVPQAMSTLNSLSMHDRWPMMFDLTKAIGFAPQSQGHSEAFKLLTQRKAVRACSR